MGRALLAIFALSVAFSASAYSQLPGRLKDQVKKAVKERLSDEDDKEANTPLDGGQSGSRPTASKDQNRKFPPGLSYSSVLGGVKLLPEKGRFSLYHIQATFLPDDCKGGSVVLRTADGTELAQFDWKPDLLKKPYSLLDVHKITDLKSGETVTAFFDLSKPGDYVLDFYIPAEHYFTYPFSVAKIGGDDPFGEGQCYVLNGDWRSWGYLYYEDAKPDMNLAWKVWLRHDGCAEKDVKIAVEIRRDKDGALVCTSREGTTYSLKSEWVRYAFDMVFPQGKEVPRGTYFKAKHLLATDGAYTLTMKIDDTLYGTWKFAIEGGKLMYSGRTVRGAADPLTFIEGGRDAWWYAREKE